jgi:hypothetical protein
MIGEQFTPCMVKWQCNLDNTGLTLMRFSREDRWVKQLKQRAERKYALNNGAFYRQVRCPSGK